MEAVTFGQEQLGREDLETFFKAYQSQICVLGLQVWWTSLCNKVSTVCVFTCRGNMTHGHDGGRR
eukprot:2672307-Rhodomonas_salina.2